MTPINYTEARRFLSSLYPSLITDVGDDSDAYASDIASNLDSAGLLYLENLQLLQANVEYYSALAEMDEEIEGDSSSYTYDKSTACVITTLKRE